MRLPRLFSRRARRPTAAQPEFTASIQPETNFIAIGDIHGEYELLRKTIDSVREVEPTTPIICVGDYIDRGEDSAGVLRFLHQSVSSSKNSVSCLLGNHEHMCLRFLNDPNGHGPTWFRYGGLQTLASFGVGHDGGSQTVVRDKLAEAMGKDLIAWLESLPAYWISGNVAVTHAGADPYQPIHTQSRRSLLWGHPGFETAPRMDGIWIVHGHTIIDEPVVTPGRIVIDTGAYATGRLTAAKVSRDGVSFMTIPRD